MSLLFPKLWLGCDLPGWCRVLAAGRFRVPPAAWPSAALITLSAAYNSLCRGVQHAVHGRRIAAFPVPENPVFIVGHWRSGTSHLHGLLCHDPQFTYPTNLDCFSPAHPLVRTPTELFVARKALPAKRPMDEMALDLGAPQEDEFALCAQGLPTPYLRFGFPETLRPEMAEPCLEEMSPKRREQWKAAHLLFLKLAAMKKPGRLMLKSPPHSFRLRVLREMHPGAVFIHIVRSPYEAVPSMVHTYRMLCREAGLQTSDFGEAEEWVLGLHERLFRKLEEDRRHIPETHFAEVRFEDLARDPLPQLRRLYGHLRLGSFESARPRFEAHLAAVAGYRARQWDIPPGLRDAIRRRCRDVLERYGYPL